MRELKYYNDKESIKKEIIKSASTKRILLIGLLIILVTFSLLLVLFEFIIFLTEHSLSLLDIIALPTLLCEALILLGLAILIDNDIKYWKLKLSIIEIVGEATGKENK